MIDVEGVEMEVLKGIHYNEYRFKYICVQCRDVDKILIYLQAHCYTLVEKLTHHDYLYKKHK